MPEYVTNTIETNDARRETLRGREYLVIEATAARVMRLNGGYVPGEEWARSQVDWNRVPLPIGHPMNARGEYITARLPEVIDNAVVGDFYHASYDADTQSLNGELWVDIEQAKSLGEYGMQIIEMLESGEPLEVSTAYRADEGEPGEYNGQYYEQVRVNLRPDHLALLPGELGPGKCSVEDGCGTTDVPPRSASAATNAAPTAEPPATEPTAGYEVTGEAGELATNVYLNMQLNALSQARTPEYADTDAAESAEGWSRPDLDGYISAYYNRSDVDTPDELPSTVSELSADARRWIAQRSLLGDPDAETADELIYFPVVTPNNILSEAAVRAARSRVGSADLSEQQMETVRRRTRELLEEVFDRDLSENAASEAAADTTADTDSDTTTDAPENADSDDADTDADADADSDDADANADGAAAAAATGDADVDDGAEPSDDASTPTNDAAARGEAAPSTEEQEALSLLQRAVRKLGWSNKADADADVEATDEAPDEATAADCACSDTTAAATGTTDSAATDTESAAAAPDAVAGQSADSPADPDDTSTDMTDYDFEHIAAQTGFSKADLEEMDDEQLATLADLANTAANAEDDTDADSEAADSDDADGDADSEAVDSDDADSDDDGTSDPDTNASVASDSAASGAEAVDVDALVEERVEELLNDESVVESLLDRHLPDGIEEVAANHLEQRQQERQQLTNEVLSNSDAYDESMLENMDDETLRATARSVRPASGTDYGARPPASANASSSDDEGPATVGTMADWKEADD